MPKQLNVNLAFTADTSQAKRQLQELQQQLNNLTSKSMSSSNTFGLTKEIEQATLAASKLKVQLAEATNPQTGTLDLGKFAESMKRGGFSDLTKGLEDYKNQLIQLGPEGKQAFLSLAESISNAEIPLLRANSVLKQMGTTIANAARWQISSSIIHGLMGAIQGAYGYAQDLNASLNSIRIVSGQTTEQMARFADQANKAAQALSTSTLAYTDASLIFYQQGLTGDAVTERVDTVLKLSNVTGDSAEQVSNYMTAIWNNFYDGSQSLESFADKITALGAATASSSAEISAGLQQFAAIGNTVGLSYDYAATALATIVAQTRQSESTVGNGLRTVFARLSSLKDGGTEDGVDLTKYTKALKEVGVNVLDQTGQLKEMDAILDDIGEKWQTLSKNQQVALAQTVGGVRQYATIMALFDNWDQFQRNLDVTRNADGTLQEQAEIYAESWEAAQKRVTAAWQAIYQDLINDKFFIGILNTIEVILKGIDHLIDGVGGLSGVLSGLGVLVTTVFGEEIANGIEKARFRLRLLTKEGRAEVEAMKASSNALASQIRFDTSTDEGIASNVVYGEINKSQELLISNAKKLSSEQTKQYQNNLSILKVIGQQVIEEGKKLDLAKKQAEQVAFETQRNMGSDKWQQNQKKYSDFTKESRSFGAEKELYDQIQNATQVGAKIDDIKKKWQSLKDDDTFDVLTEDAEKRIDELILKLETLEKENKDLSGAIKDASAAASAAQVKTEEDASKNLELDPEKIQKIADASINVGQASATAAGGLLNFKQTGDAVRKSLSSLGPAISQTSQFITKAAQSISQLTFVLSGVFNIIKTWEDETISLGDKIKTTITSGAMILPMIMALPGPLKLVAAGIVAIYFAFQKLYELSPLKRFDDAKKAVEDLSSAVDEAKDAAIRATDAYVELTSVLDGLDDKEKAIRRLAEGTQEWSEAISNSNTELLKTLETAGLLNEAELVYHKNGLITVKNAEALKQQALEASKVADLNVLVSQAALKDAQSTLSVETLSKDLWKQNIWDGITDGLNRWALSLAGDYQGIANYESKTVDSNLISSEALEGYAQQLVDNGLAGVHINEEMAHALAEANPELKFLEQIADRQDILDGISQVAEAIQGSEIGGKAYKVEAARTAAEMAGFEVPDLPESQLDDFYLNLYDKLSESLLQSLNISDISDLDISKGSENRAAAYQAFANQSEGRYSYDKVGDTLVDNQTHQNVSNINEQSIRLAYLTSLLMDSFSDLYQSTETLKNTENDWSNEIAARQQAATEQAQTNLSGSDLFSDANANDINNFINSHNSSVELEFLMTGDVDQFNTIPQLTEYLDKLTQEQHTIEVNVNAGDLTQFKGDTKELQQEFETLSQYLQDNWEDFDYLSEHLGECSAAADAVAWSMIRFDDAMQDVSENYDDWKAKLNSKDILEINEAVQDLKKTYGNLFDMDGSQFSDDFLKSANNLEKLNTVLNGTEEEAIAAYDELQRIAALDLAQNAAAEFGITLNADDFYAAYDSVMALVDEMHLVAGDTIEMGNANYDNLVSSLNSMLALIGDDVQAAQQMLAAMGFQAELENIPVEEEDSTSVQGYTTHMEPVTEQVIGEITDTGDGNDIIPTATEPVTVQGVTMTTEANEPTETTGKKKTNVQGLRIKSGSDLHYIGGGAPKIKNSPVRKTGNTGNSGGKGGKGGGGGSSKPKKKTVKEHKKPEKKEDRYHDIKERIEDLNTELKRLEKTESRVYGKAKLKYMDQEIEKLEKQIELTDEYIAEIKKYAATDQANLRGINMGATFDENGRLNNYEQVLANIVADYNNAIAAYNSEVDVFNAGAQEEEDNSRLEAADKAVNKAKELYDERLKILDQYEDTYNLLQQKMDERIDQVWELFDQRLEKITWQVEFELDWNEKELTHFDWILKYIGKDADHAADAIANLSQQMGVYEDSLNWAKAGISEIFNLHGIDFDFDNVDPQALYDQLADFMNQQSLESQLTEKEAEALLSYMDAMRDAYDGMYDAWIDAHDHMMKAWDEWQERLQNGLNDIAQYGQELEGIQKIVELTGRKMLKMTTQDINRMNQALVVNSQEYLRAATARRDALEPEVLAAEKHLQELIAGGASEEAINLAQEEYRTMMEDWQDATNEWYDAFANALQAGEDAFESFIENSTKDYKEGFGKMDLDYMQEQFDRQKKVRDLYLDDYQKYHELNKTAQELNKSLANTNNSVIRDKMLELQDDMNAAMETGVQISSAQAEIYARRVALLQAEAELLDAQNAKSAVRMTRDNEGNFSYTYTADQEQVGEAQDNYGDKFYELLDFERNYADQIQEEMLQSFQDFIDRRNEIAELYKDDQDAYNQAMEDLQEEYLAYMDYYVGELDMDLYEMQRLRDYDWLDFENITKLKLAEHNDFITSFEETIAGELTGSYNKAGDLANVWKGLMEESCRTANQAVNSYQINTQTTYEKAGENIDTYGTKVNQKFDEMANNSSITANTVENMGQDMVNTMGGIQTAAYDLDNTWAYVMDDMRQQIFTSLSALQNLMQMLDQTTAKANATIQAVAAAAQAAASMDYNNLADYGSGAGGSPSGSGGSPGGGGSRRSPGGSSSRSGGCFEAGTLILMADNSLKKIEEIRQGDLIIAYNEINNVFEEAIVNASKYYYNPKKLVKIVLENGIWIKMTPGHPIFTKDGWKSLDIENSLFEHGLEAKLLTIDDKILTINGYLSIKEIFWFTVPEEYYVFNLEIDQIHTFIANGLVVHNAADPRWSSMAAKMDTGGYTGDFGPAGKWAILHEKEIVLNKEDTANMLNVVGMVRDMVSSFNLNERLNNLLSMATTVTGIAGPQTQSLEQQVHIEANFPNVQSHTEIETALNNLINSASQYVNRKL